MSWPVVPLGDVLRGDRVGFACGKRVDGGLFQLRMNNVTSGCNLDLAERRRVPTDAVRSVDSYFLQPGDIVFNQTNSPENVGKCALIGELDELAVFSNHFIRMRMRENVAEATYIWRFLQWQFGRGVFRSMCRQWVNQATVDKSRLLALPVPLPPLDEQRRIAAILDQADAIRAKRHLLLARLNDLVDTFFAMRFPADSGLKTVALGEVAEVQGGLQVSSKRSQLPIEAPYLRVANAHRGRMDLSEVKTLRASEAEIRRTALQPGDLLIVEGHANPLEIGRVALWEGREDEVMVHQNHLIRARVSDRSVLPEFVTHWLNTPSGARHFQRAGNTTSGLNTISTSVVKAAPVRVPPLDQQHDFVAFTREVDAQKRSVAEGCRVDAELFASLQSRAFKGEL